MAPPETVPGGVLAQCQKITKTTGRWRPSKARKIPDLLAYYVGIQQKNHLAQYTVSAPLLKALVAYVKFGNAPGSNQIRHVLNSASHHGPAVRELPPNSPLEIILEMEDLDMSDGHNTDHKNQRYHGRVLTWLVHHSNGWWAQLSNEEKSSCQVMAADEFTNQFPDRNLPKFDVESPMCLPNWGPHEEFQEMEIESYNRAQELLHFLYHQATSSNAPKTIWGNNLDVFNDSSLHDESFRPTWMLPESHFDATKYVEEQIEKSTMPARTLKLNWMENGNYLVEEYGEAMKEQANAMSEHPKTLRLLTNLRQPRLLKSDPRLFDTPTPWIDMIRFELDLQGLSMNLHYLTFTAPDDQAVCGDLLETVDWQDFLDAVQSHEIITLNFVLRPLAQGEYLYETETPYGLPLQIRDTDADAYILDIVVDDSKVIPAGSLTPKVAAESNRFEPAEGDQPSPTEPLEGMEVDSPREIRNVPLEGVEKND